MIIPNSRKDVVQLHISKLFIYSMMSLIIGLSSYMVVKTLYLEALNDYLYSSNDSLQYEVEFRDDKIEKLYSINEDKEYEMAFLKDSAVQSALYFEEKLQDLEVLESEVGSLLTIINERGDTALSLPISRSIDHSMLLAVNDTTFESPNIIDDIKNVARAENEITTIINDQVAKYSNLVEDVSSQLKFMESYPDFSPTQGYVSSGFGYRTDPITGLRSFHKGLDIATSKGSPIYAAGSGVVTYSGYNGNYGHMIIISHGYDYETVYAHNNENLVEVGDFVTKGDLIAKIGTTGRSTGPHVHFEVHFEGTQINPRNTLKDY
jgi:murein DD-endopeptidase MepM/ murein hydrolase activator NlpD